MGFGSIFERLERYALSLTDGALRLVGRLARRGGLAAPTTPARRRLVVLQIDGLSSARLERATAAGEMPHLARRLSTGKLRLRRLRAASAPSTPVFQAGLLYGCCAGVPGFGWYDRTLGRTVRMDQAEDIAAVERELAHGSKRPLLVDGNSYGTIWLGVLTAGSVRIREVLIPALLGLQALPSICWLPLALLWFGLGEAAVLFVVVMGSMLSVAISTESAVRAVPPLYVRAARTMGARRLRLYAEVILPAALPGIVTGLRLGGPSPGAP